MTVWPTPETRERVRAAMDAAPRAFFLPRNVRRNADVDIPLAIGYGATNSQPSTVAQMIALLDVPAGARVLDVGSGSGWTTAILGRLTGAGGTVVGVDVVAELVAMARAALLDLEPPLPWVSVRPADGDALGLPDAGPFDRILVSADAGFVPRTLAEQLADGGRLVLPAGRHMVVVDRRGDEFHVDTAMGCYSFVPLMVAEDTAVLPGAEAFTRSAAR